MKRNPADRQLDDFIAKYSPEIAAHARAILERVREFVPGAVEMIYDNYNALVVGFGPSERASQAIFSVALYPNWVNLYFLQGAYLPDPDGILQGAGNLVRHVRITDLAQFDDPALRKLIELAKQQCEPPLDPSSPRRIVVKAIAEKQRPRRPLAGKAKKRVSA